MSGRVLYSLDQVKKKVDSYEAIILGRLLAHDDLIPFLKDHF